MNQQKAELDNAVDGIRETAFKLKDNLGGDNGLVARVDKIRQSLITKNDQTTEVDLLSDITSLGEVKIVLDGVNQVLENLAKEPASEAPSDTTTVSTDPVAPTESATDAAPPSDAAATTPASDSQFVEATT